MAVEIKVDLEMLNDVHQTYKTEIGNIRKAINELDAKINQLRTSDWKTEGADTFFQNYNDNWKEYFEDHLSYLEHLRDVLEKACSQYNDIYEEAKTLM